MPCFMCNSVIPPFQRLEVARLHFIRKAQPLFKDDSYLCAICFAQFEGIYKSKSKNKSNPSRTSISNTSIISVSTNTHNSKASSRETTTPTAIQKADGNNSCNSDDGSASVSSVVHFDSNSMDSSSSIDSTDRIVQMAPEFLSLRDSSRKTAKNPELVVARQGAEAAVRSAVKRQKTLNTENTPPASPVAVRRGHQQVVDEESSEDEDIASRLSPNNLAHVRPIVRRRKEPVVQQFDDIMDLYIKRTSGG